MENAESKRGKGPFLYTRDNVIMDLNEDFIDLTGYFRNELIGKSILDIGNMLKINSQILLENIKDGDRCYIFTKTYEPREVIICCKDLEYKHEKRYFFTEKKDSNIMEKCPYAEQLYLQNKIGIAIYSAPNLVLLRANQKYLSFLDNPYKEKSSSIGRTQREILPGFKGSYLEKIRTNIIKTGKQFYSDELQYGNFQRGITYWAVSLVPICEEGKVNYIIETVYDVTEKVKNRKLIEEQSLNIQQKNNQLEGILKNITDGTSSQMKYEKLVQNQYEFFYNMIDSMDLPIVRFSYPDFIIKDSNQKSFEFAKVVLTDFNYLVNIKNLKIMDLYADFYNSEYYKCIQLTAIEKKINYLKEVKHTIHGEELYWNFIFEPILSSKGEVEEIIVIIIDVTSEVMTNNSLQKTLKGQEEFLANISHELKTPLNVIYSTIQLFNMYFKDGSLDKRKDSIGKYINTMTQNCFRLSKLINNIVDSSKIEAGFFNLNLTNNNIVEVVEEVVLSVTNYTDSKGLTIIFDTDTEEKIIACDPEKIERIVLNLISNAVKFSDEGNEIYVDIKDKNEFIEISVKDNGIGIESSNLDMIFNRFKQVDKSLSRNNEGTGIGLSLVKSIVELHQGKISVESKLGEGSKFTFIIPARKVMQENMIFSNKMRFNTELVQMEFSDIYLT